MQDSNKCCKWIDPKIGVRKEGDRVQAKLTLNEFWRFIGICVLMAVKNEPCVQDYWSISDETIRCSEVTDSMSRNRFLYLLKILHIVLKLSIVHNKSDPRYDSIGQVRWMLEEMVKTFQSLWNPSPYPCIAEMMMAYNKKFCSFKQYLPLKPVNHRIKIWCLACLVSKFVLNLEVYIGSTNECIQGLSSHACDSGAGVVTRLTCGWENKWYTVVMDNYFTLPLLFDDLLW